MNYESKIKKYYGLKYDRVFKSVLCDEKDLEYLNKMLSYILKRDIKIKRLLNTEQKIKKYKEKLKILDALVEIETGEIIDIELNRKNDKQTKDKNLLYIASLYSQSIEKGSKIKEVKKIYLIDLEVTGRGKEGIEEYKIINPKNRKIYSEKIEIIKVNLLNYTKGWYEESKEKEGIYLVGINANEEELKKLSKENKIIKKVSEKVFRINKEGLYERTISKEEIEEIFQKIRENEFYEYFLNYML